MFVAACINKQASNIAKNKLNLNWSLLPNRKSFEAALPTNTGTTAAVRV